LSIERRGSKQEQPIIIIEENKNKKCVCEREKDHHHFQRLGIMQVARQQVGVDGRA
jgi:hypothetical protein